MRFEKGQTNRLYLTLLEDTTIVNANYLFEFICGDNNPKYCIATRLPSSTQRADAFDIVDNSNPNPMLGEVNVIPGECVLNVYEQTGTSLLPTGLNKVESTMLMVTGSMTSKQSYQHTNAKQVYSR